MRLRHDKTLITGKPAVGKYSVDTKGFEEFLENLELLNPDVELIVIDEIGSNRITLVQ